MSRPVRLTPLAEADIERAQDDYEAREQGLGNRIAATPFQYQIVSGTRDARRARVHDFPFGLWYRVEPDESIVVACLAHRCARGGRRASRQGKIARVPTESVVVSGFSRTGEPEGAEAWHIIEP